jgi:hypothetical protein
MKIKVHNSSLDPESLDATIQLEVKHLFGTDYETCVGFQWPSGWSVWVWKGGGHIKSKKRVRVLNGEYHRLLRDFSYLLDSKTSEESS